MHQNDCACERCQWSNDWSDEAPKEEVDIDKALYNLTLDLAPAYDRITNALRGIKYLRAALKEEKEKS